MHYQRLEFNNEIQELRWMPPEIMYVYTLPFPSFLLFVTLIIFLFFFFSLFSNKQPFNASAGNIYISLLNLNSSDSTLAKIKRCVFIGHDLVGDTDLQNSFWSSWYTWEWRSQQSNPGMSYITHTLTRLLILHDTQRQESDPRFQISSMMMELQVYLLHWSKIVGCMILLRFGLKENNSLSSYTLMYFYIIEENCLRGCSSITEAVAINSRSNGWCWRSSWHFSWWIWETKDCSQSRFSHCSQWKQRRWHILDHFSVI